MSNSQSFCYLALRAVLVMLIVATVFGGQVIPLLRAQLIRDWQWVSASPPNGDVLCTAISSDGEYIAAGSADKNIYLFSRDGSLLFSWGVEREVTSVCISDDGRYIAAGANPYLVYLIDTVDKKQLWEYNTGAWLYELRIAMSKDGEYVVVGQTSQPDVLLFNNTPATNKQPMWKHENAFGGVSSIALSKDDRYVVVAGTTHTVPRDGRVNLYSFLKPQYPYINFEWQYIGGGEFLSADISETGETVVAGNDDDKVYFFKYNASSLQGELAWTYTTQGDVTETALSGDGIYAAVGVDGFEKHDAYLLEIYKGYVWFKDDFWSGPPYDAKTVLAISDDANGIVYSGTGLKEAKVFAFLHDEPYWRSTTIGYVRSVAVSADGKSMVAGDDENRLYFAYDATIPEFPWMPALIFVVMAVSILATLFGWQIRRIDADR